jgi:hypothetical protein
MAPERQKCKNLVKTYLLARRFIIIMIKARAHKGGVRIGKTPKKLASICCP